MEATAVTWPPPRPVEPDVPHRPWDPGHPEAPNLANEYEVLLYVVVDELVDDWVGLSVALWPHADPEGRLRFANSQPGAEVGTSRAELRRFLRTQRGVEDNATTRPIRIGTTFAARVRKGTAFSLLDELRRRAGHGEARIKDLDALLQDPVEITAQGRLIAKLACYSAVLSTLPSYCEEQWNLVEEKHG
jgi:hypothetical protein